MGFKIKCLIYLSKMHKVRKFGFGIHSVTLRAYFQLINPRANKPFNFATLFNYSKIATSQCVHLASLPVGNNITEHTKARGVRLTLTSKPLAFMPYFLYFYVGEGFFLCIQYGRNIDPALRYRWYAVGGGGVPVPAQRLHRMAFGQELNDQIFAICKVDMLIKGNNADFIKDGNTLSDDQFEGQTFDYVLSNPPFGRELKNEKTAVEAEAKRGFAGRFGAGLPAASDG